MSDAVTIVGIVTPAGLAIAGLVYSATRDDRRIREQRRAEIDKDTGDVLDAGAQALAEALFAFEGRRRTGSDPDETGKALAERFRDARRLDLRITIRLGGQHPAATCYKAAVTALDEIAKFVYVAHGEELDKPLSGELLLTLSRASDDFLRAAHEYRLNAA